MSQTPSSSEKNPVQGVVISDSSIEKVPPNVDGEEDGHLYNTSTDNDLPNIYKTDSLLFEEYETMFEDLDSISVESRTIQIINELLFPIQEIHVDPE